MSETSALILHLIIKCIPWAHQTTCNYSMLNRTVEQSRQANPATPHDNVLGTKTAPHKEKSKKDQCERNLV